jgi:hypothetical protein
MIGSDLDNYPRITCHLYNVRGEANVSPGLEALFIKQHWPGAGRLRIGLHAAGNM